jgi:cytochrome c oxidase subunit 2
MLRKISLVAGAAMLLGACQPSPTFLNPASPIAEHQANLFWIILIMALVVFVLVEGALILILVRDRKRPNDEALPIQIYGSNRLEIIWTTIPVLLVIALFIMTVQTSKAIAAPVAAKGQLVVHVVGHRWWWEFDYPDLGIVTANELHIPAGTPVQIALESVDVIHSFWVPQLSGKTDVIPGQNNSMWIQGDTPGVFLGQCAEFCGTEHALMRFKVFVDSPADFDAWVANQQQPAYQPQTADEQAAVKTINTVCASCHSLDPSVGKTTGPNLAHLFSRTSFAGGTFDLNENNIHQWLVERDKMKPGNDMNITLTSKEIDELMTYLPHLK